MGPCEQGINPALKDGVSLCSMSVKKLSKESCFTLHKENLPLSKTQFRRFLEQCPVSELLRLAGEWVSRAALATEKARLFDECQRASRARDAFLTVASHKLKTPLTPLNLQMQMLQRLVQRDSLASLSKEQLLELFKSSVTHLQRLEGLIDDLLEASEPAAGKLTLKPVQINLSRLIENVVNQYSDQIAACKSTVYVDMDPDIFGFCSGFWNWYS